MTITIDHSDDGNTCVEIYDITKALYDENCLYRSLNGDTFVYALPDCAVTRITRDLRYDTVHLFIGTEDLRSTWLYPISHYVADPDKTIYNRLVSAVEDWFGSGANVICLGNRYEFEIA